MPLRPSGTVTFLFTDIEGSTSMLDELGPSAYAAALELHRVALRRAWELHQGVEVDTQGDSFFVAFSRAGDAADAARESQSVLREHGIRVLLVEPAYTKTSFDTNAMQPDAPLPVYAERRRVFDDVIADAMRAGDDPAIVAEVIVTAATATRPKLRYTAGPLASRVSKARRLVPAGVFDRQIRKTNRMPA